MIPRSNKKFPVAAFPCQIIINPIRSSGHDAVEIRLTTGAIAFLNLKNP